MTSPHTPSTDRWGQAWLDAHPTGSASTSRSTPFSGGVSRRASGQTYGSADAADRWRTGSTSSPYYVASKNGMSARHASDDGEPEIGTLGEVGSNVYDIGAVLFDVLNLPGTAGPGPDGRWNTEDDTTGLGPEAVVAWSIDEEGRQGQYTQMTLAGALAWLRNLATTNRDDYNYITQMLVASGYMEPGAARYGSYTNDVAAAFLQSLIDVHFLNQDEGFEGGGKVTTWFNHMDALVEGGLESGTIDGLGGGGDEALPPTRLDQFTDEATVRETIEQAARNVLGRALTDQEAGAFVSSFRSLEQKWNDDRYNAQLAQFNGQDTSITDAPNPGIAANNFIEQEHEQEAGAMAFGSYMGVLQRMVGLGGAGIGSNIA